MNSKPTWQFPPRNGGIEYIQDLSSAFFSDNPVPKLVREILQNSLDAKEPSLTSPVEVTFTETSVAPKLIGAAELKKASDSLPLIGQRTKDGPNSRSITPRR